MIVIVDFGAIFDANNEVIVFPEPVAIAKIPWKLFSFHASNAIF